MAKYKVKARAKVNIGLNVKNKRSDNYHDIETYFHLIDLADDIEIEINESKDSKIKINYLNIESPCKEEDDLMFKAASLYLKKINKDINIKIDITKNIPISSGLGGGSSDAAQILLTLNKYFENILSKEDLIKLSLLIGSDLPFFVSGFAAAKGEKRGEVLTEISPVNYPILIIKDTEKESTKIMYEKLDSIERKEKKLPPFIKELEKWQEIYINDFENLSSVSKITKETKGKFPFSYSMVNGSGGSHSIVFQDKDLSIKAKNYILKSFPEKNVIFLTNFCLFL